MPRFFCSAREGNAQRERICATSGYTSTLTRCENGCDTGTGRCSLCGNGRIDLGETCNGCPVDVVCAVGEECQDGTCVNLVDFDNDGILNEVDNCPNHFNPSQQNSDAEILQPNARYVALRDSDGDACDWNDLLQGLNEEGIDCGAQTPYQCISCTWCEENHLEPIRLKGNRDKIDIIFVPGEGADQPSVRENIEFIIKVKIFHEMKAALENSFFSSTSQRVDISFNDFEEKFNVYIYVGEGEFNGPTEQFPIDYENLVRPWADVGWGLSNCGAIGSCYGGGVASGYSRILATPGIVRTEPWGTSAVHELGHLLFSLGHNDEFIREVIDDQPISVWQTWETLEQCREAIPPTWPDLCGLVIDDDTGRTTAKYDCYLDACQLCIMGQHGFFYDGIDRSTDGSCPLVFGPASVLRAKYILDNWNQFDNPNR